MNNGAATLAKREPMNTTSSAALAPVDPRNAIAARSPDDVYRMATAVAKSGLYGVKSADEAMIRMATGMELGLSPMQSIRGVYVIASGGVSRPTLSADMMVGVCKMRTDLCKYFRLVESNDRRATYETQRVGDPEPVRMTYTMEQAQRAGLANRGTWQAHPDAMLRARAASSLARAVYQDLLNGLYDPDEAMDAAAPPAAQSPRTAPVTVAAEYVESRVVEPSESPAIGFADALRMATTLPELAGIAKQIKAAGLPEDERSFLVALYQERQKVLKTPPPADTEVPPAREPGED